MYTKGMEKRRKAYMGVVRELSAISRALDGIDLSKHVGPSEKAPAGSVPVGVMPDEMKRLWVLQEDTLKQAQESLKQFAGGDRSVVELYEASRERYMLLMQLLGEIVSEQFPEALRAAGASSSRLRIVFSQGCNISVIRVGAMDPIKDLFGGIGKSLGSCDDCDNCPAQSICRSLSGGGHRAAVGQA